jgi:hypothetical protein
LAAAVVKHTKKQNAGRIPSRRLKTCARVAGSQTAAVNIARRLALLFGLCALAGGSARAQLIFSDNFNTGASPQWGNEVGGWSATAGVYSTASPSNSPPTYSSQPYTLTDFSVTVTINALSDGGIWLRSADNANGILLITGGHLRTGTGLYWHEVQGGVASGALNEVTGLFANGSSTATITVTVIGNTYSAYVNGSPTPATTLTSALFSSGKVALYDFSPQTFDNFSVTAIPEPANAAAMAAGLALVAVWWSRRNRAAAAAGRARAI